MKLLSVLLVFMVLVAGCAAPMGSVHYQVNAPGVGQVLPGTPQPGNPQPVSVHVQAELDARRDAKLDYQKGSGACLGAGCGLFGIAGSYIYEGSVPAHRLTAIQGRSDVYISLYKQAYIKEMKRLRSKDAIGGYLGFLIIFGALVLIAGASSQ